MKKQNGITLIALVITIIVMLILVGVSVTVALNGGLFTTTEQAKTKTQVELEKEQLLEMALGAMGDNGKIVISDLDAAIAADDKFTGEDGTYTSTKTGNVYTVGERGTINGPIEGGSGNTNTSENGWKKYTMLDSQNAGGPAWILISNDGLTNNIAYCNSTGEVTDGVYVCNMTFTGPMPWTVEGNIVTMGEYSDTDTTKQYVRYQESEPLYDQQVQISLGS